MNTVQINKYLPVTTIRSYLSSRKLLLLNPPNTPLKSLPTTKNTSNKIIISPIGLVLYSYIQLKDTKNDELRKQSIDFNIHIDL